MNKWYSEIILSLRNLNRNKGRTFLSILGVTIGIATVLMIFSIGESIRTILIAQVSSFGTDYIQVETREPSNNSASGTIGATITTLTLGDAEAIKKSGMTRDYYGALMSQKVATYKEYNKNVFIYGVSSSFYGIDPITLAEGRFYTAEEEESLARVVVLGASVAETMFGNEDPLGKRIKVGGVEYQVIGVFNRKGGSLFFDLDTFVYVPLKTVQRLVLGVNYVNFIFNRKAFDINAEEAAVEVRRVLRDRHDITDPTKDDFNVATAEEALGILSGVTDGISILLLLLASISLIVGAVGITNIMYVTVTERVPEIGLRKAMGATRKNIQNQFLMESVIITLFGGIVGSIIGTILIVLVAWIARSQKFDWPIVILPQYYLISCGVAALVGLIAGYRPAQKAAKLDPIVALRREE